MKRSYLAQKLAENVCWTYDEKHHRSCEISPKTIGTSTIRNGESMQFYIEGGSEKI